MIGTSAGSHRQVQAIPDHVAWKAWQDLPRAWALVGKSMHSSYTKKLVMPLSYTPLQHMIAQTLVALRSRRPQVLPIQQQAVCHKARVQNLNSEDKIGMSISKVYRSTQQRIWLAAKQR